jgi:MFS family permease
MNTEPAAPAARPRALEAFRTPHFGAVWLSNVLQFFGTQVQLFTLQWLVTDLTASRTILGLVTSIQGATVAAASPVAGVAADRLPRRDVLVASRLAIAAGVLVMSGLAGSGRLVLWHVFPFAVGLGLLTALAQPATLTYVVDVVGRERAQNAVALNSAGIGLGQMAGPALAGVLVASIGIMGSWLGAAGGLAAAALLLVRIPIRGRGESTSRAPWRELRDGFAYVLGTPPVLLALLACSMAFFNGALFAMRPVFARHVLEVGSEGMGVMAASAGLGNLLGALGATALPQFRRPGIAIATSMLGFSLCIFLYAFAFSYPYILAVEFASGLCAQLWQISAFSGLQLAVPEAMRGRVMGLLFTVVQFAQVGGVFVGMLADRIGDQAAMGIFGAIPVTVLTVLLIFGRGTLRRLGLDTAGGLHDLR